MTARGFLHDWDEGSERDDFALEDFDSEDLDWNDSDEGDDYISDMWGNYGFRQGGTFRSQADDLVVAYGMVKTIVKVFTKPGETYVIVFDPKAKTAASDMRVRKIMLTSAPVLDPSLTAKKAGLILTALACHEVAHFRYGKMTNAAVRRRFGDRRLPNLISNVLDDVRIERRFVHEFPGYAGVFDPLLEYVASYPDAPRVLSMSIDPLTFMIGAVRYDKWKTYTPDSLAERDWWRKWADRWAKEDSPTRHVAGVREALDHINLNRAKNVTPKQPLIPVKSDAQGVDIDSDLDDLFGKDDAEDTQESAGERTERPQETDEEREARSKPSVQVSINEGAHQKPEDMSDEDAVIAASEEVMEKRGDGWVGSDLPAETDESAVSKAGRVEGVKAAEEERLNSQATRIIMESEEKEDGIWVTRNRRGTVKARKQDNYYGWGGRHGDKVKRSGVAARYVKEAFLRARISHKGVTRYQKRGHLDSHALHRVPGGDIRCFERRTAPSPQNALIFMLIDCSGSMGESVADAASVAWAFAEASQHMNNLRLQVWAWTDNIVKDRPGPGAARFWSDGEPLVRLKDLADVNQGGTPDGPTMRWARKQILKELRAGEKGIILMLSDGAGYVSTMINEVTEARSNGLDVKGIAIGSSMRERDLKQIYGPLGYVTWQGSIEATAKPMAKLITRSIAKRTETSVMIDEGTGA